MTNIIVPNDFSTASLQLASQAVQILNRPVRIFFFHAFDMPFYYQDLIRPDRKPWQDLMTDKFRQGCRQLKERFPNSIHKISPLYMTGSTNALFRNLMDMHNIDIIVCPNDYVYTKIHADSLNPVPFFKKSGVSLLQDLTPRRVHIAGLGKKRAANEQLENAADF